MVNKNKSLLKDIFISVPITLIYLLFINKLLELFTENMMAEERFKRHIIYSFIIGIVSIVIGIYIFGNTGLRNRSVKFAFILGSILLILYSLYNNWGSLQTDSKLLIIGSVFALTIAISYVI
jgi:hypothetical protein